MSSICFACGYPSDGNLLCIDCRDGIAWAKSQRLQADFTRRTKVLTDYGFIACEMLGLLERSPEMRQIEDKAWTYMLTKIHPIHGKASEQAYANTRTLLCEYLSDHLDQQPNPCSKPTPTEYTDWLWVCTTIIGFLKDNPKLRQVEPELWEWMLNQTYPLPPNHAPTARNMTKAILEQFMGDYGPTVMMIQELESRLEQERLSKQTAPAMTVTEPPMSYEEAQKQGLEPAERLSDYERREDLPKPTTTKRGRR